MENSTKIIIGIAAGILVAVAIWLFLKWRAKTNEDKAAAEAAAAKLAADKLAAQTAQNDMLEKAKVAATEVKEEPLTITTITK